MKAEFILNHTCTIKSVAEVGLVGGSVDGTTSCMTCTGIPLGLQMTNNED